MRILLVSQYFWPESFIINDLVRTLVAQGHFVHVLTGKPNYPEGVVFDGYSSAGCSKDEFAGSVPVYRVPLRPRRSGGAKNLALNYGSFVANGLRYFHDAVKGRSFDVIFVFAMSPITMAIPAIYLKWRLKSHLAVWVQDLWPESLRATGFVRNAAVLKLVSWLVRGIYKAADTILIQSKGFLDPVSKYADRKKVFYYPNSFRDSRVPHLLQTQIPIEILEVLERDFCVVFAGNLGTAQAVDTIVEASERLRMLPRCRIVLVGSGSMGNWLERQKRAKGLNNLVLAGRYPPSEMEQFFKRAAGLLVTLKREEIFSYTIPSKIQAYLAAGRPIIAALDGEGARVVEEAKAGLTCPAEDADGLARCIEKLYCMAPAERERLGQSGRSYFVEHFEMERQARELVELLERRIIESTGTST